MQKTSHSLRRLLRQNTDDPFRKLFPKAHGHNAFYVRVSPNLCFRVYMVKHLFSCVGEAEILEFFVSYRDVRQLQTLPIPKGSRSFGFDCPPEEGVRILNTLKTTGYCDLKKYFRSVLR